MAGGGSMAAAVLETHGGPLSIRDVMRPTAAPGGVLVRIPASGVNPLDTKIFAGKAPHARQPLPAILGIDLAGTVAAVGEGVTGFRAGDAVYGMAGGAGGVQGSLARYAAVDAALLAPKPANLSVREAAALPLVFITAWEGLVDKTRVHAGHHVLVHGAPVASVISPSRSPVPTARRSPPPDRSGAGRRLRCSVPTSSTAPRRLLLTWPVTCAIAASTSCSTMSVVPRWTTRSMPWRGAGMLSARLAGARIRWRLGRSRRRYSGIFTLLALLTGEGRAHHGEIMREATRLVEAGAVTPIVDARHFTLETVLDAYRVVEAGGARTKLVIDVT